MGIACLNVIMISKKRYLLPSIAFSLTALWVASAASGQSPPLDQSWLDRPLINWNRPSADFPRLPAPADATNLDQCREAIRQPISQAEEALLRRGWKLFGPVQNLGMTQLITATSGFDGMCRPLGYQVFVYVEGRYAGTLSPVLMNSRTDGALLKTQLLSPTEIRADFARYSESDPLCCPSRTSFVSYRIRPDEVSDLVATQVLTRDNQPNSNSATTGANNKMTELAGTRWQLSAIAEQPLQTSDLYIEFDAQQQRFSGFSGCNRFAGGFSRAGTTLTLSQIASTRRACLDAAAQRTETDFLQALEAVTRFEIQADTLRLYAGDLLVLVFKN